jgi:hypothetical protein
VLKFADLIDGALYSIHFEDGTGVGCGERDEIARLAAEDTANPILGAPLDQLRFERLV